MSVSAPRLPPFITQNGDGTFTKNMALFVDNDQYLTEAWWYCLPGVARTDVKLETFRVAPPANHIVDKANNCGNSVELLRGVRFWGFAPPDAPHGDALSDDTRVLATSLCQWQMTPPYGLAE